MCIISLVPCSQFRVSINKNQHLQNSSLNYPQLTCLSISYGNKLISLTITLARFSQLNTQTQAIICQMHCTLHVLLGLNLCRNSLQIHKEKREGVLSMITCGTGVEEKSGISSQLFHIQQKIRLPRTAISRVFSFSTPNRRYSDSNRMCCNCASPHGRG